MGVVRIAKMLTFVMPEFRRITCESVFVILDRKLAVSKGKG